MAFTLDKLANALRGMARDALIMIRLPGGKLVEIDHVTATFTRGRGHDVTTTSNHKGHTVVLVPVGCSTEPVPPLRED